MSSQSLRRFVAPFLALALIADLAACGRFGFGPDPDEEPVLDSPDGGDGRESIRPGSAECGVRANGWPSSGNVRVIVQDRFGEVLLSEVAELDHLYRVEDCSDTASFLFVSVDFSVLIRDVRAGEQIDLPFANSGSYVQANIELSSGAAGADSYELHMGCEQPVAAPAPGSSRVVLVERNCLADEDTLNALAVAKKDGNIVAFNYLNDVAYSSETAPTSALSSWNMSLSHRTLNTTHIPSGIDVLRLGTRATRNGRRYFKNHEVATSGETSLSTQQVVPADSFVDRYEAFASVERNGRTRSMSVPISGASIDLDLDELLPELDDVVVETSDPRRVFVELETSMSIEPDDAVFTLIDLPGPGRHVFWVLSRGSNRFLVPTIPDAYSPWLLAADRVPEVSTIVTRGVTEYRFSDYYAPAFMIPDASDAAVLSTSFSSYLVAPENPAIGSGQRPEP